MHRYLTSILLSIFLLQTSSVSAHSSFELHKADFYAVLGFQENAEVTAWMKQISSKMIDGYKGVELPEYGGLNFYDYLKAQFPGFKCKHRLLFHWGYNARPWNDELQAKVDALPWGKNSDEVKRFQTALVNEQRRRNGEANAMTENLFGFASSGKEASYANAMISIVYDVHIIGDYTPDNSDFDGLQNFRSVIGDLINALRKLDEEEAKPLVKKIQTISNDDSISVHMRAEKLLTLLANEIPEFLQNSQEGSLVRRFREQRIFFQ